MAVTSGIMPMTAAIAPRFSKRHPRAAAIFDNLHMTHDIISDILTAESILRERKRAVMYAQLDELRDMTRNVMSREEWRRMGEMMGGVAVMGGPPTGLLRGSATPKAPGAGAEQHPDSAAAGRGHEMPHMHHMPMDGRSRIGSRLPTRAAEHQH